MRKQTGSRNRGWLPMIGNRLSVAAGVALAVGMMAGTAWGWSPDYLATGGDVTNIIGPINGKYYGVHQFTNTVGTAYFTPLTAPLTVEYLVIGGGGGGGSDDSSWMEGGGGGGGGFVTGTISLASGPYSVTVGGGGAGSTQYSDLNGANGSNSVFNGVTAYGGGGGGSGYAPSQAGNNGGCGGGGYGEGVHAGGTGTQGYNGGSGVGSAGGGGGGAGSQGADASSNTGGNGGAGKASSISGVTTNYAGGGGAGGNSGRGKGTDGGGNGGITTGGSGTDGLGGGGGGGNSGGKGGSGIVIVRYEISPPSVNLTAPTNNQVFAWNASIAATATVANATVTSVDFYTNTASAAYGLAGSDSDPTGGYTLSLASGSLPAGTNHIYAVMTATEGTFTSAVNTIIVETLPVVTVAYPTDGQSFANLSSITATATVSHGISPYTVTFYTNNETAVGTDSSAPYASSSLGPLGEGSYQIYAKVTDSNPNGADTVYSTTNTFTILAPALAVSVAGPTEYPYDGMIASTATVTFVASPYTVKFWTSSVPATVWGQAGADGISTSPYGVSFGPLAPGSYSIRATVDDSYPASATSSTYTVTVLQAPTVTLNTPTPGQQFAWNSSVTGTVTCTPGKAPYSVTFYTNKNGSAYGPAGTDVGTGTRTSFTNVLSSLGTGTYGIYAVVTDGYGSQATSGTNIVLVGGTLPTLSHRPPTAVTTGSATFNGFLSTTGNPSTYVYVLYGQNPNAWSFTNAVTAPGGGWTNNSPISVNIGSLAEGTYYYTIGASNGAPFGATMTASGTTNFITGEVTVQNTGGSAQYKAGGSNNGQFTIYRPATCTNAALVVSYTLSGATVSPSGSATLNAGSTSAVVTVAPSVVVGNNSNAVLTLTAGAGNYPYGTPANSATCTVLAADVTPTAPFWAWGGDSNFTTTVSGRLYAVHMYTNVGSGYFVPSKPIKNVEYLVVGGGGGGGSYDSGYAGGGGGAGGLITSVADGHSGGGTAGVGSAPNSPTNLTASTPYPVTVGAGGGAGVKGGDSSFGSFATASGGGYGGGRFLVGSSGGSGGGGAYGGVGGGGTTGQGWAGGSNLADKGGGGGGAGNVGQNATSSTAGDGGPGLTNSITGSDVAYAGGGGGQLPTTGTGGSGVGGNGNSLGTNGRGGGGGGFAAGGSGIVIVRYDISPPKGTMILLR